MRAADLTLGRLLCGIEMLRECCQSQVRLLPVDLEDDEEEECRSQEVIKMHTSG